MLELPSSMPQDRLGRPLGELRISVTDRCNMRCGYCMPKSVFGAGYRFLPREELLTFEEIRRVAARCIELGVRKIRLTGGEPLLRRDLERLIEMLAGFPLDDLALTTNGVLLAERARALADAGLGRVTVSLDALEDKVFRRTTDSGLPVGRVLDGIEAAQRAGLGPVKINVVVQRGVNDDQILPLARYFKNTNCIVRFIEFMDVGASNGWRADEVVPADEMVAAIDAELPLRAVQAGPNDVARRWQYEDGQGEIGVIASVTKPFCGGCNRARLSADGQLFTCLFASKGHDLKAAVRGSSNDQALRAEIVRIWSRRADRYSEQRGVVPVAGPRVEMSFIGG